MEKETYINKVNRNRTSYSPLRKRKDRTSYIRMNVTFSFQNNIRI